MTTDDLGNNPSHAEAERSVRNCINRYMAMCDDLNQSTDLDGLMDLFTVYAVWEGVGEYAKTFGRLNGRPAIREMFAKYMTDPPHFAMNVHMLGNEKIDVAESGTTAIGRWVLLQPSTFSSGDSQLSCAKLKVSFVQERDGVWRMNHFQTERQFSRPMEEPWNAKSDLPVPGGNAQQSAPAQQSTPKKPTPPPVQKARPQNHVQSQSAPIASKPVIAKQALATDTQNHGNGTTRVAFDKGMVTEKKIDSLASTVQTITLSKGARLTPLAQDRLRKRNIKIERA